MPLTISRQLIIQKSVENNKNNREKALQAAKRAFHTDSAQRQKEQEIETYFNTTWDQRDKTITWDQRNETIASSDPTDATHKLIDTIFHWGSEEELEQALQSVKDINRGDLDARSPLHWALIQRVNYAAEFLIKKGANVNEFCRPLSLTPLLLAVFNNDLNMFKFLLNKGADLFFTTKEYGSALDVATKENCTEIVAFAEKYLKDKKA